MSATPKASVVGTPTLRSHSRSPISDDVRSLSDGWVELAPEEFSRARTSGEIRRNSFGTMQGDDDINSEIATDSPLRVISPSKSQSRLSAEILDEIGGADPSDSLIASLQRGKSLFSQRFNRAILRLFDMSGSTSANLFINEGFGLAKPAVKNHIRLLLRQKRNLSGL